MDSATAARIAKVSPTTIRTWCRLGAVAATKTSGHWDITPASLGQHVERREELAAARRAPRAVVYSIDTMTAIGGSRWTKAGHDRVYINNWAEFAGLDVARYNTGNISSAAWQGEGIANRQAGLILGSIDKVWFDAADGKLHCRYGFTQSRVADRDEVWQAVISGVRTAIAAL